MYKRIRKLALHYIPAVLKTNLTYRLPGLYPLLEIRPSSCNIVITNRCNLRCRMCKQWQKPPGSELSGADWKRIIDQLRRNGISSLHFTGGEPLLRRDLVELVAYGNQQGFSVGLTTNGMLLKRELLEQLLKAGLRSVAISIDDLAEQYDNLRGVDKAFAQVEEAAGLVADFRRKRGIDAYINFVLMNETLDGFKRLKNFADGLELPIAVCLLDKHSVLFDLEDNKHKFWISSEEDFYRLDQFLNFLKQEKLNHPRSLLLNFPMLEFIRAYFRDPRQRQVPCVSSQDRIMIDPDGNLLGGCLSMGSFGNVKDRPFGELKKEPRYRQAKKDMFYKNCAGCSCGYQFNIRCLAALLIKDLAQRVRYLIKDKDAI